MVNKDNPNEQAKSHKNNRSLIFGLWLVVAIVLIGLFLFTQLRTNNDPCPGDVKIPGGERLGGDFELLDEKGQTITRDELITGPTLMYFGYSFCPDICPIDTVRNAEVTDILAKKGIEITPVMVTVDPERDTPEVMGEYVSYIHDKMRGLSGSVEQVEVAKKAYKAYGEKQAGDDPEYYLIDHSAFTYFEMPSGVKAVYSRTQNAEEIASNIECKIQHLDD